MTPAEADAHVGMAAVYVHIPFCSAVCPYCDFAVVAGKDGMAARYVEAVISEIAISDPWRPLEAVYFGGGTPSHVAPEMLAAILDALAARHGITSDAEISLEANPEDFEPSHASRLAGIGFNRVSFGAQSFDEAVLTELGRRHGPGQIAMSVWTAREAGFADVSLDLIYGSPGETTGSWSESLEQALRLEPDHLSCYALTVEPGTPLSRQVRAGAPGPDPDTQADRYEWAVDNVGMGHYEVSNWAHPGHECRYNLIVWAQGEYEAYGNGAHGHRDGIRFRNHRRLEAYVDGVEEGARPRAGEDSIAGWDAELDRLFVGLRRRVGVAQGPGTSALVASYEGHRLTEAGAIAVGDGRLIVARPLLTDAVLRSVMALEGPIVSGETHA